jgi:hypothetical protein
MPNRTLRVAILFGGILATLFAAHMTANDIRKSGTVALSSEKRKVLKPSSGFEIAHTDKVHGPLVSTVVLLNESNGLILLEATVTSSKLVEAVKYVWNIPEGMEIVNGQLRSEIREIAPLIPFKTRITVRQTVPGNKQVHFVVSASLNGYSFSSVSQYNSTDESFIQEQKRLVKESLKVEAQRANRVMH